LRYGGREDGGRDDGGREGRLGAPPLGSWLGLAGPAPCDWAEATSEAAMARMLVITSDILNGPEKRALLGMDGEP
jgi:hypothetical protein